MYDMRGLLKKYYGFIIGLVGVGFLQNMMIFIYPILISELFQDIGAYKTLWDIKWYIIISLIAIVIINILKHVFDSIRTKFYERFNLEESAYIYSKVFEINYETLKMNKGDYYVHKIYNAVDSIAGFLANNIVKQWIMWTNLLVVVVLIATVNIVVAVIVSILIPINYFLCKKLNEEIIEGNRKIKDDEDETLNNINDIINNVQGVKLHNVDNYFYNRIKAYMENLQEQRSFFYRYKNDSKLVLEFANNIIIIASISVTSILLILEIINISRWIFIIMLIVIYYNNLKLFTVRYSSLNNAKDNLKFINEEILKKKEYEGANKISIDVIKSIECNIKSFEYINKQQVLKNLNVSFYQGEKIAIIGEEGSGKSTLWKLILKLYKSEGIFINGFKLNIINNQSIRNLIWVISKDVGIFPGTIKENIFLNETITPDKLKYISSLKFMEYFNSLPNGLDTYIYKSDNKLSEEHIQIIEICRVLVRNPEIIILDEPTYFIKKEYEEEIYKEIYKVFEKKMIILITNNLELLEKSEIIFRIKEGEVVNQFSSVEELKTRYTM